jgi:hypothetical protein
MCEDWKTHFEKLATPAENENFYNSYDQDVQIDMELLRDLAKAEDQPIPVFIFEEVRKAIASLNPNKG